MACLTAKDEAKIVDMYKKHYGTKKIMKEYRICCRRLYKILDEHGVQRIKREIRPITEEEALEMFRLFQSGVKKYKICEKYHIGEERLNSILFGNRSEHEPKKLIEREEERRKKRPKSYLNENAAAAKEIRRSTERKNRSEASENTGNGATQKGRREKRKN